MSKFTNEFLKYYLTNPIILTILILGLISVIFYKRIIGWFGEHWVKKELKKLSSEYKIINDLMIETRDKLTHQIDHIIVSKYGIFVIETKQYNGYIIGNDYDKKWTIKSGNKKYYINNPVHQNYGHLKAIKEVLETDENKFISIVCIPSKAKLKIDSKVVVSINELLNKINGYKEPIINNADELYEKVMKLNIVDKEQRKQHVTYVKEVKTLNEEESKNKCPKCGGILVEREGKYGKFLGCSNYPKCKYMQKI